MNAIFQSSKQMRLILLLFFTIFFESIYAQSNLFGRVLNTSNTAIPFAGVSLKGDTNQSERFIQTDSLGKFDFKNLQKGKYILAFSHMGYEPAELSFYLASDTSFTIHMPEKSKRLDEVVITGNTAVIERSANKVVYNLNNSITATGSNALEAVSKVPGVRIGSNQINVVGKGLVKVMVNNHLLQLQGEDLMRYLRSLSSNEITRIELLANPSAKYEAEGNAGLINIITKRSRRQGYSGSLQLASKYYLPGISSRYGVRTFGEISGSGNISYNRNNFSAYGSFNHSRDRHLEGFETDVFYPDKTWLQTDTGLYTHNAFNVILGIDYKISRETTIGISYSGGRDNYDGSDNVRNPVYNLSGQLDSLFNTYATYYPVALPVSLNVHTDIKLDTTGKQLFFNADYFNYYRTDRSDFQSDSYDGSGNLNPEGQTRYFDRNKQNISVYTFKADADLPTSFAKYSFGAKLSFISNYSNAFYYNKAGNGSLSYNTNLSNEFDYTENTQALYGSISKDIKKWKFEAGIRGELTQTKGFSYTLRQITVNNYLKLFPSLLVSYEAGATNIYSISVGRRINRPSFWNLNPFKSLFTASSYGEGNPYLQPEYNTNVELSHTLSDVLTTSVFFNKTDNGFGSVTMAAADTNLVYTRPLNFIHTKRVGISENISFKPIAHWESNELISLYYTDAQSSISNIRDLKGFGAYFSSSNNIYFNAAKTLAAAVNFWYQFPEVDHVAKASRYYKLDLGFKASVVDKKWDIAVILNDAFRSSASSVSYIVNDIPQKFTNFQINRYVQLNLNYHFGAGLTGNSNRSTGNEEERGRIH
ncbi:outer membrane beta-barrel protein [Rubrolithibacter danxiaensis]|uniref:outer membrane beta-barrel protein n=1 Tax=Rubrolithibacter danxiaensis TaxID=3390805 RepID=UPI003BF789E8